MNIEKRLKIEQYIIITIGWAIIFFMCYLAIQLYRFEPPYTSFEPKGKNILVIATHEDDETIIAGGRLIQIANTKGMAHVVIVTKGQYLLGLDTIIPGLSNFYFHIRKEETIKAMKIAGLKPKDITFLQFQDTNNMKIYQTKTKELVLLLENIIKKINPDEIYIPLYEGGHQLHDITNFAAFIAYKRTNCSALMYEACEYNNYISWYTPRKALQNLIRYFTSIFGGDFFFPPDFLPAEIQSDLNFHKADQRLELKMTTEEILRKIDMLNKYKSQNVSLKLTSGLVPELSPDVTNRYSFPDRFRPYPGYNYSFPPFPIKTSFAYKYKSIKNFFAENLDIGDAVSTDKYAVGKITFQEFYSAIKDVWENNR